MPKLPPDTPHNVARWAHRLSERQLLKANERHLRQQEMIARTDAKLARFRDVPDEDWDPNFAPITAADLHRRRTLAGR